MNPVTKTALVVITLKLIMSARVNGNDPHYMRHECSRSDLSYTSGSKFHADLNHTLLEFFPNKVLPQKSATLVTGRGTDQISAVSYCRRDVTDADCQNCVLTAGVALLQYCRFLKEAIIWYEECTVRYANRSILSLEEEVPSYRYYNFSSVLKSLDQHQQVFDSTKNGLIHHAGLDTAGGFAQGEAGLSGSGLTLRVLVQCSPDIVGGPCQKCLKSAVKQMDGWSTPMIFQPSCVMRFDLFPSHTNPIQPEKPKWWLTKVVVPVAVICLVLVAILLILLIHHQKNQINCRLPSPGQDDYAKLRKFHYWELALATFFFSRRLRLGGGGFGPVYWGILPNRKEVAIKRLNFESSDQGDIEFHSEIEAIGHVKHQNVVSLYGYCIHHQERLLVYEYVPNRTLHHHLHKSYDDVLPLSWEIRQMIAIRLAGAFQFLHESNPGVIHRDIKPANILIDSMYQPKVGDFGLAKLCPKSRSSIRTRVKGTHGYLDPYYFRNERLTRESDVFAFGIVLLELISGRRSHFLVEDSREVVPIMDWAEPLIKKALLAQPTDSFDELIDPKLENVYDLDQVRRVAACAALCVRPVPSQRPSMQEVLEVLEGSQSLMERSTEALKEYWQNEDRVQRLSSISASHSNAGESSWSSDHEYAESQEFFSPLNPSLLSAAAAKLSQFFWKRSWPGYGRSDVRDKQTDLRNIVQTA